MTHAKFHFNWLMLTSIFGIWASEPPPRAWRTTEKAGPDRVNCLPVSVSVILFCFCWQYWRKTVIKKEIAILRIDHHILNFSQTKYSVLLKAYVQGREM